jgi:hypothetical protein
LGSVIGYTVMLFGSQDAKPTLLSHQLRMDLLESFMAGSNEGHGVVSREAMSNERIVLRRRGRLICSATPSPGRAGGPAPKANVQNRSLSAKPPRQRRLDVLISSTRDWTGSSPASPAHVRAGLLALLPSRSFAGSISGAEAIKHLEMVRISLARWVGSSAV